MNKSNMHVVHSEQLSKQLNRKEKKCHLKDITWKKSAVNLWLASTLIGVYELMMMQSGYSLVLRDDVRPILILNGDRLCFETEARAMLAAQKHYEDTMKARRRK